MRLEIGLDTDDSVNVKTSLGALVAVVPSLVLVIDVLVTNSMVVIGDVVQRQRQQQHEHLFDLAIEFELMAVIVCSLHCCHHMDAIAYVNYLLVCSVPCDLCSCSNVWLLASMNLDRQHLKNLSLRQHNDGIRLWISLHRYFPNVFPKHFDGAMCANDERLIPKYQLFPILPHFHLPVETKTKYTILIRNWTKKIISHCFDNFQLLPKKRKATRKNLRKCKKIENLEKKKSNKNTWILIEILTVCKAFVMSSLSSSKHRLIRARRLRSNIGFMIFLFFSKKK